MLENPATGGTHWFHGTPNTFGKFRSTDDLDHSNMVHPAWNSGVGHHFTSLHDVANRFISGGNGEPNPNGWHIHAKLAVENPKVYGSEHDMLHHAAQVLDPANEHQRVFHHPSGKVHDIPITDDGTGPLSTETHLKMRPGSAKRFREHLIRQGHDGVIYGNEFEGPKGHLCAIVFHHDQIKEADRHAGHAPDLPREHIAKKKRHDNSHHVKHKTRVVHHPGWPGYHPWCTGFYFGGGYIGHDGACPAHDGGGSPAVDAGDGGDGAGSVGGGGDGGGSMGSHRHVAKWGEPTAEHVERTHHEYLRRHYDDTPEGILDPHLHDHVYPVRHDRPDGPTTQHQARNCPGWKPSECTHSFTKTKMAPLAQQTWDVEHDRLLDPEAHAKRQQDMKDSMAGFLLDYKLDHPDRVHTWNEDGSLGGSHDPRLGAVLTDWKPTKRLFAPTEETTDPRLFGVDNKMRPEVRKAVLDSIDNQWRQHADWRTWARVYLAGSEASKWYGNNDFDILVGVDYSEFRKANPRYNDLTDQEITDALNRGFAATYNNEEWHPPFDPEHEWHRTGYCNLRSYDIRRIKPYAAYDVGNDEWAVEPPDEPQGHQFDPSLFYYAEGVAEQIKNVMRLSEPERSQQAKRLWTFLHEDRARAFGPNGTGAYDRGNVVEKYLDQAGLWEPLVKLRFPKTGSIPQESGYDGGHGDGEHHLGGKGKPRSGPARGQDAQAPAGQGQQEGQGDQPRGDEAPPPLVVKWHSATDGDMKRMDKPLKKKIFARVDELAANGGRHSTTHPLKEVVPGWHSTRVDFLHRIVHQIDPDDGKLHVGYVGPHDYEKARRRLRKGAVTEDPCKCCNGTGEHPSGHECYRCDASGQERWAQGECDAETLAKGAHLDPNDLMGLSNSREYIGADPVEVHPMVDNDGGPAMLKHLKDDHRVKTTDELVGKTTAEISAAHDRAHAFEDSQRGKATERYMPPPHTHDRRHFDPYRDGTMHSLSISNWESEVDLKKRMDANHALNEHLALHHQGLVSSGRSHAVTDMLHRIAHGTVGPQQQLDFDSDHHHDSLIDPRLPFSVRHRTSAIKLRCADCDTDYFTDGEPHNCTTKEARVKVVPSDGDDSKVGIMVAIAPPARIVEDLVLEEGESAENLHITLAYLGDVDEHSEAQVDMLPELVEAWAEGQPKLDARVQGAGTFVNEGSHVLWAAADIPGVNEMHVSLVQYLTGHGFDVRKDHSFTPHITLAYGKTHFRFLPKIAPTEWKVREVWCCIGGRWESFPLRG